MIRLSSFFFLVIFTFQVMDIPPVRNAQNHKTCCGRMICLCQHGKGKPCDFHKIKKAVSTAPAAHSHCALKKTKPSEAVKQTETKQPHTGTSFSKSPCGTDSPKSIVRGYSKDYIFNPNPVQFSVIPKRLYQNSDSFRLPSVREYDIYHPPQPLPLFF